MLKHVHGIGEFGHGRQDDPRLLGSRHAKDFFIGAVAQDAGNAFGAEMLDDRGVVINHDDVFSGGKKRSG